MKNDLQERADTLFDEARASAGMSHDPRDLYRDNLKQLKTSDTEAYDALVEHFQKRLLPSIADKGVDPLIAWREFGLEIAVRTQAGRTVSIGPCGAASEFNPGDPLDRLILHLPAKSNVRAILVGLPPQLSEAQQASYDWLVSGSKKLPDEDRRSA